ncbi:MAG: IS1595 family transposase, partial [Dysgonomonas sp.]
GRAHIKHVKSNGSRALIPEIINNAFVGSTFYSDEWRAYKVLGKTNLFQHETVKHRIGEYVRDNIHTNTIEGVWSQLKRSIDGTFHHVSAKHLHRYLDEFCFRYNMRGISCSSVFGKLIGNILANF